MLRPIKFNSRTCLLTFNSVHGSPIARLLSPEAGEEKTQQPYLPNYKLILVYLKNHPGDALDSHPKGDLDFD